MSQSRKNNPGYLKLDLMLKGVRLDDSLIQKKKVLHQYRLSANCLGRLDLILPHETYVSVPYQEDFAKNSPYKLRYIKKKFYLTATDDMVPVNLIAQPEFYDQKINEQVKMGDVVSVHGNYVSLALGGHRYLQSNLFDENASAQNSHLVINVDEMIAVLERVRKDRPIQIVSLSCWSAHSEDGGISELEPYIRAIKSYFNVLVLVGLNLPRMDSAIDLTRSTGVDSICYHIGKSEVHQGLVISKLKHAANIFPTGRVLAHLAIDDQHLDHTFSDIAALSALKVLPILTVESSEGAFNQGLDVEKLVPLFAFVYETSKNHKIPMNWFSHLSPFVTPIEGRFFVRDMSRLELAYLNFCQSRLSKKEK